MTILVAKTINKLNLKLKINMKKAELKYIPINEIIVQPQVRTIFDEEPMIQLAESVHSKGVLQPIAVNQVKDKLYLICGERRYRAQNLVIKGFTNTKGEKITGDASRNFIPATIYADLLPDEVLQMQIIENLHRKDVHPMEEAIAFKRMMTDNNFDIVEISKRVTRSIKYVGARIKLTSLIPEFQKVFYAGRMSMTTAHELCKVSEDGQKTIYAGKKGHDEIRVDDWTLKQYKKDLKKAPFDIKDEDLVKAAGSCIVCPHNTAASSQLFPDESGQSICMNAKCFSNKCAVSFMVKLKQAKEDPRMVFLSSEYHANESDIKAAGGVKVYTRYNFDEVTKPAQKDIDTGKVLKGFFVSGDAKGHTVYCKIAKAIKGSGAARSGKPSAAEFKEKQSSGKATAADINVEIQRMINAEKRKKEIDMEKAYPALHNLLYDCKKFVFNAGPLSVAESCLLIIRLLDKINYSFDACDWDEDAYLKTQGFKGDKDAAEFFAWLLANKSKHSSMLQTLSRVFFYSNAQENHREDDAAQEALIGVIKEYMPKELKEIQDEVSENRSKRDAKLTQAIASLKAQLKDSPVKKGPKKSVKKKK
jgi:ParB-like chromosome segregation protein Spo0J